MRPHVVRWLEAALPDRLAAALAPTWFTCIGLAGVVALLAMHARARRHRLDPSAVARVVLWAYVAAVAAGIVVPAVIDAAVQLGTSGRVRIRWAGMTSFWGYLAGGWAVVAACRAHDLPLGWFAELATVPLGIALMLARLGCFLAGCDYGKVSALPWAVRFPAHSPAWQDHVRAGLVAADRAVSLPVHPTQLYEAALGLMMAVAARGMARRLGARRGDGGVFLVAAAIYGVGRFAIEEVRGDTERGIYFGLSSGQIFSLLLVAAVAAIGTWRRARRLHATAATGLAVLLVLQTPDARAEPAPGTRQARPERSPPSTPGDTGARSPTPSSTPGDTGARSSAPSSTPGDTGAPPPAPPSTPGDTGARSSAPSSTPGDTGARSSAPSSTPGDTGARSPAPYAAPGETAPLLPPSVPLTPPRDPSAPADADAGAGPRGLVVHGGALVGVAAAFNRRRDQVPALAGASLSIGVARDQLALWLDLESLGNRDASHGTVLLSGGMTLPVSSRLSIGGRFGLGATLVNFDDPVFRDVVGVTTRFEVMLDVGLAESWALWLRPLALDVLAAADLGGPIATWQARVGVAYHFAVGRRPTSAPPRGAVAAMRPLR